MVQNEFALSIVLKLPQIANRKRCAENMAEFNERPDGQISEEEYRRRQAAKAKRRQKRRMQKIILLATFALAVVLLVVVIVLIFRAIFKPKDDKAKDPSTSLPSSSLVGSGVEPSDSVPIPGLSWPVAPNPDLPELVLINQMVPMADGWEPELTTVTEVGHRFGALGADQLKQMVQDCNANEGFSLAIASGYRGPQTQNEKYQNLVTQFKAQGMDDAAAEAAARRIEPPFGQSDHQTGLAVDFTTLLAPEPSPSFGETQEYQWLLQNAANYGFILRFPAEKTDITGIDYLPYHFRYVGVEDAKVIAQAGICLEEYLAVMPQPQVDPPAESDSSAVDSSPESAGSSVAE